MGLAERGNYSLADHDFIATSPLTIVKVAVLRRKYLFLGEIGRFSHSSDHSFVK
jgi:hypothetical protein